VNFGPVDHYLGLAATTMGHVARAQLHFNAALEMANRMRTAPFVAETQYEYGAALLAGGDGAEEPRARRLLRQALVTAERLGMTPLAERAQALLA
jgi:hypothetical protein